MSHRGKKPAEIAVTETREPQTPRPGLTGTSGVVLTGEDEDECIEVTIHEVKHHMHSATACELSTMLAGRIDEWNEIAHAGA